LALGLCPAAPPLAAEAQPSKVYRIGMLWAGTPEENTSRKDSFLGGLRELGWAEGRTIIFEERWANGEYVRLPKLASELVALKVDLIVANNGTPAAKAAMKATRDIPIVVPAMSDPIANKLVTSLAHPGGNLTGLSNVASELYPKRVALLKEALPGVTRVALLLNDENPFASEAQLLSRSAGQTLGIQIETINVRQTSDFESAFEKITHARSQAVIAGTDIVFLGWAKQLGELAVSRRLPLIAGYYAPGALLTYSVDNIWSYQRAATYVDKILKGAKAGDLPIEQPTKFTLIIDLKTAKALGLTVPKELLLRADEVIQ